VQEFAISLPLLRAKHPAFPPEVWSIFLTSQDAGGVTEGSRRLSEAIPPERGAMRRTLKWVPETSDVALCFLTMITLSSKPLGDGGRKNDSWPVVLASLRDASAFLSFPEVSASLRPPATLCQPFELLNKWPNSRGQSILLFPDTLFYRSRNAERCGKSPRHDMRHNGFIVTCSFLSEACALSLHTQRNSLSPKIVPFREQRT